MAVAGGVGFGILSLGVGFTTQIYKNIDRSHKDQKMQLSAPQIELGQQDQVYQILSCLVEGVYAADRGKKDAADFWTKLGYEEFKLGYEEFKLGYEEFNLEEQHSPTTELADVGKPMNARLMLFRRRHGDGANCKPPLANVLKCPSQTQMPKYVVAIRGTIKKNPDDFHANFLNVFEMLHTHDHYFQSVGW